MPGTSGLADFVGLGLLHRLPYWAHVGIAAALFIAQVYFSRYWLARYRIGPGEWMWMKLSRTVPVTRAAGVGRRKDYSNSAHICIYHSGRTDNLKP